MDKTRSQTEQQENARRIKTEIQILGDLFQESRFKEFWGKVKQIGQLFKELKPLTRSDREELWEKYSALCQKAREQREERASQSESLKYKILAEISLFTHASGPMLWNPFGADEIVESEIINREIQKARQRLTEILDKIKDGKNILTREDSQTCWEKWKASSDSLNDTYQSICDRDHYCLDKEVCNVWNDAHRSDNFKDVKDAIKSIQLRVRSAVLKKDQRDELFKNLNQAWEDVCFRQNDNYQRKHDAWVEKTKSWIEHQEEARENKRSFVNKLENEISRLRDDISSSNNDSFIERAEGWIAEKEEKIAEVESQIESIDRNIEENRSKLED